MTSQPTTHISSLQFSDGYQTMNQLFPVLQVLILDQSHVTGLTRSYLSESDMVKQIVMKSGGILNPNHWFCSPGCYPVQDSVNELKCSLQSAGHPLWHPETLEVICKKIRAEMYQNRNT